MILALINLPKIMISTVETQFAFHPGLNKSDCCITAPVVSNSASVWEAAVMVCRTEERSPFVNHLGSRFAHWELMGFLEAVACWGVF